MLMSLLIGIFCVIRTRTPTYVNIPSVVEEIQLLMFHSLFCLITDQNKTVLVQRRIQMTDFVSNII